MNASPTPLAPPANATDARLLHLLRHIANTAEGKALLAYLQAYKAREAA